MSLPTLRAPGRSERSGPGNSASPPRGHPRAPSAVAAPRHVIAGGPSYALQLDVRHAVSMAGLVCASALLHRESISLSYKHRVPVAMARNELFREALDRETADVLLWVDSDVSFDPLLALDVIAYIRTTGSVCVGVPVLRRASCRFNVLDRTTDLLGGDDDDRWMRRNELPTDKPEPVDAMGTGMIAFRLDAYRELWPEGPWFVDLYNSETDLISEDVFHTASLKKKLGYRILCWPGQATHHDRGAR